MLRGRKTQSDKTWQASEPNLDMVEMLLELSDQGV